MMKEPKKPSRPCKPSPPEKIIQFNGSINLLDHYYNGDMLSDVLKQIPAEIDYSKVAIVDNGYGYDDGYRLYLEYYWEGENPNYDKELKKYEDKLEKYKSKLADYKKSMESYKVELEAYEKWWRQNKIETLKRELEELVEE